MKYYSVQQGRHPGIYYSWQECQEQTKGYPGAVFKSFDTLEQAEQFLTDTAQPQPINDNLPCAYIDGSYSKKSGLYGYGGYIIADGKTTIIQGTGSAADYIEYRNITGEIRGAIEIYRLAHKAGIKEINLFYDYAGIEQWATGAWICKNKLTAYYKAFFDKYKKLIQVHFCHVQGHTGIEGNEIADLLAKEAVHAKMTKKQAAQIEQFKAAGAFTLSAKEAERKRENNSNSTNIE